MLYRPRTKWTWAYFIVTLLNATIALSLQRSVLSTRIITVIDGLTKYSYVLIVAQNSLSSNNIAFREANIVITSTSFLLFGFIYQFFLLYDTLAQQSTIQLFGMLAYSFSLCVYMGIQCWVFAEYAQHEASLDQVDLFNTLAFRHRLVAMASVTGFILIVMSFITYKLYYEYAWTIYKYVSADLLLKKRYLRLQIYLALLKLDFFFFVGFLIQSIASRRGIPSAEVGAIITILPITILSLLAASFLTRHENRIGGLIITVCHNYYEILSCADTDQTYHIILLAFNIFILVSAYQRDFPYILIRYLLTYFAVITIVLNIATIVMAFYCIKQFGHGVKRLVAGSRRANELQVAYESGTQVGQTGIFGFRMAPVRRTRMEVE